MATSISSSKDWALNCNDSTGEEEASYSLEQGLSNAKSSYSWKMPSRDSFSREEESCFWRSFQQHWKWWIYWIHTYYIPHFKAKESRCLLLRFFLLFFLLFEGFLFFLSFLHIKKEEKSSSIFAQIAHCNNWVVVLLFSWSCWSRLAHTMSREPLKDAAAAAHHIVSFFFLE